MLLLAPIREPGSPAGITATSRLFRALNAMKRTPWSRTLGLLPILLVFPLACAKGAHSAGTEVAPEARELNRTPVTVLPNPAFAALGSAGATSIADVTERVLPSVVNISLTKMTKIQGGMQNGPFPFFFG